MLTPTIILIMLSSNIEKGTYHYMYKSSTQYAEINMQGKIKWPHFPLVRQAHSPFWYKAEGTIAVKDLCIGVKLC
jgi:hypothetical protein